MPQPRAFAARAAAPAPPARFPRGFLEWSSALEDAYLYDSALRRAVKILLDFCCGALAVTVALGVEDGARVRAPDTAWLAAGVGCLLVLGHALGGSYRAIWRYTSLAEAIVVALSTGVAAIALLVTRYLNLVPLDGSAILLVALLTLFGCIGVRALRRWQATTTKQLRRERRVSSPLRAPRRVLIVGAGEHGLSIGRELAEGGSDEVELAGYLDDDPSKIGAVLNGARVLGPLAHAATVCERYRIAEVIVAMPSADPSLLHAFVRQLEDVGIRTRAVHGVERFVAGEELHRPGAVKLHELIGGAPVRDRPTPSGDHLRRRVLVAGGAGYIGSHLVRMLLERGYRVRVLDRFDYGRAGIAGVHHPNLETVQGDICNSRDVSRAVKSVDGVIALAAIVGDPACNLDPEETINLNYTATKILAETCHFYGVRRLVFASSCSVYGASSRGLLTETSRLNPVSLYARTRVLSENILFDRHGDVEPVIVRLATVFGLSPRMRFDLVVNALTVRAVMDKRISIFGGGQWRPNVHCRDAARAFILALEAPASDVAGQIFNLGGEALNHRISEIGEMVARLVGDVEVEIRDDAADPRDYRVSFAKIRRVLGFEPEYSVADGIREVAAAVRADATLRRWQDSGFHNVHALKEMFVAPRRRRDDFPAARTLAQA